MPPFRVQRSTSRSSCNEIRIRIVLLGCLWLPIAAAIGVRFYFVQVRAHERYLGEARKRYVAIRRSTGRRGEIFDVSGSLLVGNRPCVKLSCSPFEIKDINKRRRLAAILAAHCGTSFDEQMRRLEPLRPRLDRQGRPETDAEGKPVMRRNTYYLIGRTLSLRQAETIREQLRANRIPLGAFEFKPDYQRAYPKGRMLANVLGYINIVEDTAVPQAGLERRLAGETDPGSVKITYERGRDGTPLDFGAFASFESRDGKNIYLTISEPIQAILEEELEVAYRKYTPDAVYGAIADPKTGNILALAQLPSFDPNDRSTFRAEAIRTRIADDAFEPGSIMKPFSIGKALDWGVVRPETKVDCTGGCWYYLGKPMRDTHDYGMLSVAGVIQKSSNIGTAKIALMLGEERLCQALQLFGFGTRTGLPFPNESPGRKPVPNPRDKLAVTRMPIGYSVSASPLQLLRAYCALANPAGMPKLRLIDRIEDPEDGKVIHSPVEASKPVFEHESARRELIEMMISVTRPGGTATKAAVPGYPVAGKTGTSRKYVAGRGYAAGAYFGSFVGFVPARNPRMVMVVTMDNPRGASYGGVVSAPVFRAVAERVLRYWNVPPEEPLGKPEKTSRHGLD